MGNFLHLKKVAKQMFYFSKPYCKNQTKRKEKIFLLYLKLKKKNPQQITSYFLRG